jgi:MYXO-CTERM domain-containing protein
MAFDIRLPIGLLFTALGLILIAYGAVADPAIYRAHSLGVNIDLAWGAVMTLFGLVLLALAALTRRRPESRP